MPRDRRGQIGMVRVANDEMPCALAHFETACEVEAAQVVLTPAERRAADALKEFLGSLHEPTLASAPQPENVLVQIRARGKRVREGGH